MVEFTPDPLLNGRMKPLLVMIPLPHEQAPLVEGLLGVDFDEVQVGRVKAIADRERSVFLAVGGLGKVQFALTTQHLIRELDPRGVIAVGAGGRLHQGVEPLDLVVATDTVEHDFTARFVPKPLPRFPGDPGMIAKLQEIENWNGFKVHFGSVASGDEDIVAPERVAEIRTKTDALAVAWEGAGGARACRFQGLPYLEVRAITDGANAQAYEDFKKNLRRCMLNAAELIRVLK